MKKILKSLKLLWKRIMRRPAIFVVTLYANHLYRQGVKAADKRWKKERQMIYLASKTFHPDVLTTYDKRKFKAERSCFGYHAIRLITLPYLKRWCFYHTPDREGREALTPRDKEIRRRAFIKDRLRMAGLLEKPKKQ